MAVAKRDDNAVPTIVGVSSADGVTPVRAKVDPVTGYVLMQIVSTSYTTTNKTPSRDDNGVPPMRGVTNNASQTVRPLISDPNNDGHVLCDVLTM